MSIFGRGLYGLAAVFVLAGLFMDHSVNVKLVVMAGILGMVATILVTSRR